MAQLQPTFAAGGVRARFRFIARRKIYPVLLRLCLRHRHADRPLTSEGAEQPINGGDTICKLRGINFAGIPQNDYGPRRRFGASFIALNHIALLRNNSTIGRGHNVDFLVCRKVSSSGFLPWWNRKSLAKSICQQSVAYLH